MWHNYATFVLLHFSNLLYFEGNRQNSYARRLFAQHLPGLKKHHRGYRGVLSPKTFVSHAAILDYGQPEKSRPRCFVAVLAAEMMHDAGIVERLGRRLYRRTLQPAAAARRELKRSDAPHTIAAQLELLMEQTALTNVTTFNVLSSHEIPGLRYTPPVSTTARQVADQKRLRAEAIVFCARKQWA